ncbi:MAG: hypothetical protein Q8942_10840 [Bacillota bacterium]|nr:hypothetical protein [Bacillota bacterium]
MGEIMAVIVILLLIIMVFVPLAYLNYTNANTEEVKQTLSLSCKVLINNIEDNSINMEEISRGYQVEDISSVSIDMKKLIKEFDQSVYSNAGNVENFNKVNSCILLKALVLRDKFFITKKIETKPGVFEDSWGPPYFYTAAAFYGKQEFLIYMNTKDDRVVYFDENGNEKRDKVISDFSIGPDSVLSFTRELKTKIIIDKINMEMQKNSTELGVRNGLGIKIKNPFDESVDNKVNYANVNVLNGGITFFVLYGENSFLTSDSKEFNFRNYNVAGYSMSY